MKVYFKSSKLQKACNSEKNARRVWGVKNARQILLRLDELLAAHDLSVMYFMPRANFHPLKGDRQGQFAVYAKHPFRVVFEPANEPVPLKADGGIDLSKVTEVRILEVVDYHGG